MTNLRVCVCSISERGLLYKQVLRILRITSALHYCTDLNGVKSIK